MFTLVRYTFSYVLLLIMLFQAFGKMVYVVDYYLNKDYIAKELCVNKGTPQSNCEGSCHLKSQLEEHDKKEQTSSSPSKEKKEIDIKLFHEKLQLTENSLNVFVSQYSPYSFHFLNQAQGSVFHPPKV